MRTARWPLTPACQSGDKRSGMVVRSDSSSPSPLRPTRSLTSRSDYGWPRSGQGHVREHLAILFFLLSRSRSSPPSSHLLFSLCVRSPSSFLHLSSRSIFFTRSTVFLSLPPSLYLPCPFFFSIPSHLSPSHPLPSLRLSQLVNSLIPSSLFSSSASLALLTSQPSNPFISIHLISPGLPPRRPSPAAVITRSSTPTSVHTSWCNTVTGILYEGYAWCYSRFLYTHINKFPLRHVNQQPANNYNYYYYFF